MFLKKYKSYLIGGCLILAGLGLGNGQILSAGLGHVLSNPQTTVSVTEEGEQ